MEEYLQKLVTELGEAINTSINDSEAVNVALAKLRAAGHDVFLILEATIAFKENIESNVISGKEPAVEFSYEDRQFLRSLNIRFDPDE